MEKLKNLYGKFEEVIRYLIFGGLTTAVNIAVFFLCDTTLGMNYLVANAISIVVSIIFAFLTNKKYVFKTKTPTFKESLSEFFRFCTFRLLSAVFDMLSMWVLVDGIHFDANAAKLATQFIVVVLNYAFSKWFIFKQRG